MLDDVKNAFKIQLEEVDWMSNISKAKAVKKLSAMKAMIAYPDEMNRNTTAIDEIYKTVSK